MKKIKYKKMKNLFRTFKTIDRHLPTFTIPTISSQKEALNELIKLENLIRSRALAICKKHTYFRFEFYVASSGNFILRGRYGYKMTESSASKELRFVGKTIEETVQKFCNFFNGERKHISIDGEFKYGAGRCEKEKFYCRFTYLRMTKEWWVEEILVS